MGELRPTHRSPAGTPSDADVGSYGNIVISVSDGKATPALAPFTITVSHIQLGAATLTWLPPPRTPTARRSPTSPVTGSATVAAPRNSPNCRASEPRHHERGRGEPGERQLVLHRERLQYERRRKRVLEPRREDDPLATGESRRCAGRGSCAAPACPTNPAGWTRFTNFAPNSLYYPGNFVTNGPGEAVGERSNNAGRQTHSC
jgi:hypothetical protein